MYKIMVIEDDTAMANAIKKQIEAWGNVVMCARDFQNVISEFIKFDPHMVLIDIMLPFYNGYYWCTEIRKISNVPVIFLSSASDNMNIVMAMNMGADDFIAKPFSLDVLSAKIQAVLRRSYESRQEAYLLEYQGVVLKMGDASILYKERQAELSKNEFRIMELLFERAGGLVSREELMKKLWDDECFVDDNTLTVNITRIRKKLEEIGLLDFIRTKKGIGYYLQGVAGEGKTR